MPGFYKAFREGATLVNSAIKLSVATDGENVGKYKYRVCSEGKKTSIEHYFDFIYPDKKSDLFPDQFAMPITDVYLENLSVVYKKDYLHFLNFLKALNLSESAKLKAKDTKFSHTFNDLVIWPNKAELNLKASQYGIKGKKKNEARPSYVQIPTLPFIEKAGPNINRSYRLLGVLIIAFIMFLLR